MKQFTIEYGATALKELESLPARQRGQILRKIERLEHGLVGNVKRLQNADCAYRLRMGNYRVLFDIQGTVIIIRRIGDRKEIYD